MDVPAARSQANPAASTSLQKRNIRRVVLLTLGGAIVTLMLYLYLLVQTGDRRIYLLIASISFLIVAVVASLILIQRDRIKAGVRLLVGAILVTVGGGSLLIVGMGLGLGLGIIFIMPLMVLQLMLPTKETYTLSIASILTGAAALLLDLYWPLPFNRMTIPHIQIVYFFIIGAGLLTAATMITRQLGNFTLRAKFMMAFMIITLVPLGLQGLVGNLVSRNTLTRNANQALTSAAEQTANSLDTFINNTLNAIRTDSQWSPLVEYLGLPPDQRAGSTAEKQAFDLLSSLIRRDLIYIDSWALLDEQGTNLIDTRLDAVNDDESGYDYFQTPMQTNLSFISPVEFDAGGNAFLYFSNPVRDAAGRASGVLRVRYKAEVLQQLVNQHKGSIGEQSFAILLDENLFYLAHGDDPTLVYKFARSLDPSHISELLAARRLPDAPIEQLVAAQADFERGLENAAQQPYFAAEMHSAANHIEQVAVATLETRPWRVIFAQPQAIFLSPIDMQTRTAFTLALVIAGLVAGGAIAVAHLLTRQIVQLTNVVQQVTQGNLAVRAPVRTRDEIGMLSSSFNIMTKQLEDLVSSLEARVEARTAQLRVGAQVARAASSILNPQELLQQTVDLICDQFGYYYAAVFLVDEKAAPDEPLYARLRAGRGAPGQTMLERGHKFEMGAGMVGWVCANKQARIALDVGQDAVRFANPLLPNTRSEIALPLQLGERILGALDVQSEQAAAFDESDVAVLQGMADQIAVALENAHLFTQTQASLAQNEQLILQIQTSLKETTTLYAAGQAIAAAQDNAAIFQALVENVIGPEADLCLLVLFDPYETDAPQSLEINQIWTRSGAPGLDAGTRFDVPNFPLRHALNARDLTLQHRDEAPPDVATQEMWERFEVKTLAFIPLNIGARWIGSLGIGSCIDHALGPDELRPYQAVATQTATALENRRLLASSEESLGELKALYQTYTREAWSAALQAKADVEYEYRREKQTGPLPAYTGQMLCVPLAVHGQQIGVLELETGSRPWSEQERTLAEAVGTQAALALERARLFDQTQRLAGRERLINEITARIRASTGVSAILQTAARELATAMNVPHAVARIHLGEGDTAGERD